MTSARKAAPRKATPVKTTAGRARLRSVDNDRVRDAVQNAADQAKSEQAQTPHYRIADVRDVKSFAADLSDKYLECRDSGHKYKLTDYAKHGRGFSRRKYCPNCKYEITQTFDSRGMLVKEEPRYPEGYLAKGLGRVNRDGKGAMRVESFKRALAKQK